MNQRHFSFFDRLIIQTDQVARTLAGKPLVTERSNPSQEQPEAALSQTEHALSAKLMRINHAGEVAAQALYQGQALTARLETVRDQMATAASEENDHLAWCEHRVKELNDHVSYANPLWYAGSFTLGAIAGLAGDKWSLGFVAETERQVVEHLDAHLHQLSLNDKKSRAIIEQMRSDEQHHGETAAAAGGVGLPGPVKHLMQLTSKVMTTVLDGFSQPGCGFNYRWISAFF